jgi:hypothetical protein
VNFFVPDGDGTAHGACHRDPSQFKEMKETPYIFLNAFPFQGQEP